MEFISVGIDDLHLFFWALGVAVESGATGRRIISVNC